ncbi:prepilin peptidase CpaA [Enhydrobacter aerosaccus]|uniref:Prepilin peptidase CpaA n=1 Tax=Enhydrobacter aerosaccus TaxID=225324 RepID=A0A1T4T8P5_9HYPH|nr:prepilin peptidase [Enhydrobacter aerosaccus]SKA36920.1 prepilin peptidase CpaA [Enhydrobacter aerosaccus]
MSLLALLQLCCVAVFALLLVSAGWQDLKTMRIANGISLGIGASFAIWAGAGVLLDRVAAVQVGLSLACALFVFLVGTVGFALGAIGGGDVKLLAAASLFAGPAHQIDFLTVTACAGGLLALAALAGARLGPSKSDGPGVTRERLRQALPYGPAIAMGGLWVAASLMTS